MAKKLRFFYVVASSPLFAAFVIPIANYMLKHPEKFTDEQRYEWAMKMVRHMAKKSHTSTDTFGKENLPEEGGYTLYSNHQGKYDALGIMIAHEKPLSMLWEEKSADRPMARQVRDLAKGKTIRFDDYKGQIRVLNEIAQEVSKGAKFLIFPEGGYANNRNFLQEFKSGCFMAAYLSVIHYNKTGAAEAGGRSHHSLFQTCRSSYNLKRRSGLIGIINTPVSPYSV